MITFFESSDHSDPKILALMTNDLGLEYSDAPMWKPSDNIPLERRKILAAPQQMDDLLWMYLQNIMLNVDGVRCAIYMMPADVAPQNGSVRCVLSLTSGLPEVQQSTPTEQAIFAHRTGGGDTGIRATHQHERQSF